MDESQFQAKITTYIVDNNARVCALLALVFYLFLLVDIYSWPGASIAGHNSASYIAANQGTDMVAYLGNANGLLKGEWPKGAFYRAPLYSFFAAFCLLISDSILWICIMQIVVAVFTVWITCRLTGFFFGNYAALLSGLLLIFYGGYAYFTVIPISAVLEVFFATLSLFILSLWRKDNSLKYAFFVGVIGALTCLARPNYLAVFPVALAGVLLEKYLALKTIKGILKPAAVSCAGVAIFLLPVIIWNNMHTDKLTHITTNGPATYKDSNSYDSTVFCSLHTQKPIMPVTSLAFWKHQFKKGIAYWVNMEYPQNVDFYVFGNYSHVLTLFLVGFGLIGALFWGSFYYFLPDWKTYWPLYWYVIGYALTVIAFYIIGRYRIPPVPAMLALGSGFTVKIFNELRSKVSYESIYFRTRKYASIVIFVAVLLLSQPWKTVQRVNSWSRIAGCYLMDFDFAGYKFCLAKILEINPQHSSTKMNLAAISLFESDFDTAMALVLSERQKKPGSIYLKKTEEEIILFNDVILGRKPPGLWREYLKNERYKGHIGNFYQHLKEIILLRKKLGLPDDKIYNGTILVN